MQRTGGFGLVGLARVDALDFNRARVEMLKAELEEEQRRASSLEWGKGAALVVFRNCVAAACASQAMHGADARQWTVSPAPEPRDLICENLGVALSLRSVREVVVYGLVALTVLFYMVPIGFISAIISLDNLEKWLPELHLLLKRHPVCCKRTSRNWLSCKRMGTRWLVCELVLMEQQAAVLKLIFPVALSFL